MTPLSSAHHPSAARRPAGAAVGAAFGPRLSRLAGRHGRRRARRAGRARGSAGRPAGLAGAQARRRRGHRPGAARRGRLQSRRGRGRPGGDRRARGAGGSARARAAGSGSSRRAPSSTAICGGAPISPTQLERAARPGPPALSPGDRGRSSTLLVDRFGCALLLDCHSMPPPRAGRAADRLRRLPRPQPPTRGSAREALAIARAAASTPGSTIRSPAGMSIERHGAPARGVHALQIEIDRRCYLDARRLRRRRAPRFDSASRWR